MSRINVNIEYCKNCNKHKGVKLRKISGGKKDFTSEIPEEFFADVMTHRIIRKKRTT